MDVPPDVSIGSLDTSNDLEDGISSHAADVAKPVTYLRDDIKPCIYLDLGEATDHGAAHICMSAELEPKGKNSQSVLKRFLIS